MEKIQEQFDKNPHLRVLFFFDEGKEMAEEIEQLQLGNIKVINYSNDSFNLKVKLNNEWASDKIFLYFPFAAPAKQEEYKKFPIQTTHSVPR